MILELDDSHSKTVLDAMFTVVDSGDVPATGLDQDTIRWASAVALGRDDFEFEGLSRVSPDALSEMPLTPEKADRAMQIISIVALLGEHLDPGRAKAMNLIALDLDVSEEYLEIITSAAAGDFETAAEAMSRRNAESFLSLEDDWQNPDPLASLMPYRDANQDPELESRYLRLEQLPEGTFGRAFFIHFTENNLNFPGHVDGQVEGFATTHDTCHLLGGYPTNEGGEVLTAAFIAGMHDRKPMESQIIPGIFSWHLGIELTWLVGSRKGAFEPEGFWTAWDRGRATTRDVFDPDFDFWAVVDLPLDEVRTDFGVPPLESSLIN